MTQFVKKLPKGAEFIKEVKGIGRYYTKGQYMYRVFKCKTWWDEDDEEICIQRWKM